MIAHPLRFYEIKTKKSEITDSGVLQLSFACEDKPEIFCFLWINQGKELKHIQFLFGESVLEWESNWGILVSQTNRVNNHEAKIGVHKGSRSIHSIDDPNLLSESLDQIKRCKLPEGWNEQVHAKFHS
jgi:hypothetical protein